MDTTVISPIILLVLAPWVFSCHPEPEAKGLVGKGSHPTKENLEVETTPHQMLRGFAPQHDREVTRHW